MGNYPPKNSTADLGAVCLTGTINHVIRECALEHKPHSVKKKLSLWLPYCRLSSWMRTVDNAERFRPFTLGLEYRVHYALFASK